MATTKKRAKARAKKKPARRASAPRKRTAAKKAKRRAAPKPRPRPRPKAKPVPPPAAEIEKELRRLRSARNSLERRLTAAVQEIGLLRQYELRAQMLEGELGTLRLQSEERIRELESRLHGASIVAAPE